MKKITVYRTAYAAEKRAKANLLEQEIAISFHELRYWIKTKKIFKHLFRYKNATLVTYDLKLISKPFASSLIIWTLARGKALRCDQKGNREKICLNLLLVQFSKLISDLIKKKDFIKKIEKEVDHLLQELEDKKGISLNLKLSPIYLRTDLFFGLQSGGSLTHIAGVFNHLFFFTAKPIFISSDPISTVDQSLKRYIIPPRDSYWDFSELPSFAYNRIFFKRAKKIIEKEKPAFIYQRYSLNHFSGVKLAKHFQIPFVLEYNGSEIWIARNWGTPLKYEALAEKIEKFNLKSADLIIVVSEPLKKELMTKGIDAQKILVNPNGVNPEIYSPLVDGSQIRKLYAMRDKVVIGFIGTFGKWHGVEILAESFGMLLNRYPDLKKSVHLFMIGDGLTMPLVKQILKKHLVDKFCTLTGIIPQEKGPQYLAACDLFVTPHVPNEDSSAFFGSPTKLFEYMAMGKGIVASDLNQIGAVLKHNSTALLVKPKDPLSLMNGIKTLINDPNLRKQLGQAARNIAVDQYSWKEHTRKIIAKLRELFPEKKT